MDQLPAQVFVAALADPEQLWLAAGGELSGNHTEPCGEIPSTVEALRLTDSGDKGGGDDRADAGDRHQPTSLFVLLHPADELGVESRDPSIKLGPLRASVGDEHDHPWAQACSALLIHQDAQKLLELPLALRRDHPALKQNGAQLIDQSRPLADQPISRSMKRLHIELVLALQFDKPHRRPRRRFRDPLGVAIVVLLRLDIRADIFGRHQPHIVAVSGEHAAKMMGAAAGLHPDNARRKLLRQSNQRLPSHLTPHNHRAGRIQTDDAADVLAKVDAKDRNIHTPSSS